MKKFMMADYEQDPGYQFRLSEGQKAIDRSAAARGGASWRGAWSGATTYAANGKYASATTLRDSVTPARFRRDTRSQAILADRTEYLRIDNDALLALVLRALQGVQAATKQFFAESSVS